MSALWVRTLLALGACTAVLGTAWGLSLSAIRDPGGYADSFRTFVAWPYDKTVHAGGAALTMLVLLALFRLPPLVAGGVTMLAGLGVEFAERFPRVRYTSSRIGFFSWRDLVADALGMTIGWLAWMGWHSLL